jgi:chitin disaccharide deacetylase
MPELRGARKLIVNADDFGASHGVNRGILECHVDGVVTSASLMVEGPAAREAAETARDHPRLSLGLHFVDDGDDVARALARQLASFERLVGGPPTHVDSHHHFHRDDDVFPRFCALLEPLGVPVRGDGRIAWIGGFYAQWEEGVTNLEYVSVGSFERLLREEVRAGWTELACHPGYRSGGFRSSYFAEREAEVRTLTDARLQESIAELDIQLANYADFEDRCVSSL